MSSIMFSRPQWSMLPYEFYYSDKILSYNIYSMSKWQCLLDVLKSYTYNKVHSTLSIGHFGSNVLDLNQNITISKQEN